MSTVTDVEFTANLKTIEQLLGIEVEADPRTPCLSMLVLPTGTGAELTAAIDSAHASVAEAKEAITIDGVNPPPDVIVDLAEGLIYGCIYDAVNGMRLEAVTEIAGPGLDEIQGDLSALIFDDRY